MKNLMLAVVVALSFSAFAFAQTPAAPTDKPADSATVTPPAPAETAPTAAPEKKAKGKKKHAKHHKGATSN